MGLSCKLAAFFVLAPALLSEGRASDDPPLKLYIDADFSITRDAAEAIVLGLEAALSIADEGSDHLNIEIVPHDHRGSPRRSHATMEAFAEDPAGLAVIGGMQSPPYLSYGPQINKAGLPLLLPWSAAAPITRLAEGDENWIFRLSIDDSKAGEFLVDRAVAMGCSKKALILIDTGWGRSNERVMTAAMQKHRTHPSSVLYIDESIGPAMARTAVRDLADIGTDCVLMVSTPDAGAAVMLALHELLPAVRLISHWGILGYGFEEKVSHEIRDELELRVLQTCAFEVEEDGSPVLDAALTQLIKQDLAVASLSELRASIGFVHAFDLGLILRAAVEQASGTDAWAEGISGKRKALKTALETLETPVNGILRTYNRPFSKMTESTPDAHEALGKDDLCLASFRSDGRLSATSDR